MCDLTSGFQPDGTATENPPGCWYRTNPVGTGAGPVDGGLVGGTTALCCVLGFALSPKNECPISTPPSTTTATSATTAPIATIIRRRRSSPALPPAGRS